MNIKIGEKIKALRKRDDITQEKLAEALGVTNQAISRWESGNGYPDIEYISPIANFFNVTRDYLFEHDLAEKRKKIDEYCEKYDAHKREWNPVQERVNMMRQALAEFPAEEKLLIRLADALWYKWCADVRAQGSGEWKDGKWVHNFEVHRATGGWEEAVKIMEELLASSTNDFIRGQCRELLAHIYGNTGEKEKVLKIAKICPDCETRMLFWALEDKDDDAPMYQQKLVINAVSSLLRHFTAAAGKTKDLKLEIEATNIVLNLYKFIFSDNNYGFYSAFTGSLYCDYAKLMLRGNKIDEAFEALENAYEHAKLFDAYLDEVRGKGEYKYTSPFMNLIKDYSKNVHATKNVPEFLNLCLKDEHDFIYKNLHNDPRYAEFVNRIEADLI